MQFSLYVLNQLRCSEENHIEFLGGISFFLSVSSNEVKNASGMVGLDFVSCGYVVLNSEC